MSHVNVFMWRYMSTWICICEVVNESCECICLKLCMRPVNVSRRR